MTTDVDTDRSPCRRESGRRAGMRSLLLVVSSLGIGLLVGSCDTTAKVTFQSRSFSRVESSGFIAPANACGQLGADGNENVKMRFVMVSGDDEPIRPGETLEGGTVNVDDESISPSDPRLFGHPDLACGEQANTNSQGLRGPGEQFPQNGDAGIGDAGTPDGGGNGGGNGGGSTSGEVFASFDGTCTQQNYSCEITVDSNDDRLQRCQTQTNVSVEQDGVNFVADTDAAQLFGVLVENSRSTGGARPTRIEGWSFDADGDGTAERDSFLRIEDRIATDGESQRKTALQQLAQSWSDARALAVREDRETRFAAWPITGAARPESLVSGDQAWTTEPDEVRAAADSLDINNVAENEANIVEAMINILDDEYGRQEFDGYDKTLTVLVDGPPALPVAPRGGVSVQDVVDRATEFGVRIFIVQLDTSLDTSQIFDNPNYWEAQNENCSGESDCENFETCREVRGYSTTAPPDNLEQKPEGEFCMPQYREDDGRLGPIGMYGRIACATNGGYIYVKTPRDLSSSMSWLPFTMDGLWEVDLSVAAFASTRQNFASDRGIRMQANVGISAGNTTRNLEFSQIGGEDRESSTEGSGDTRSVLFTGDP